MEGNQSAYYGQYYIPLQNLEQEILQWLRKLVDAYAKQAGETPVEHIRSRIKTAEGMQEKLHKKGFETTADSALANVSDIVGFRLVTHFVGEVYDIVERMKQDGTFRIVKEKDYIAPIVSTFSLSPLTTPSALLLTLNSSCFFAAKGSYSIFNCSAMSIIRKGRSLTVAFPFANLE